MKLFEIFGEIGLQGQEAVEAGLNSVSDASRSVAERFEGFGTSVQEFGKEVTSAGKSMSMFVTGPIVAVGAGLFALTKSTADHADQLAKTSQQVGTSIEAYQTLTYAMEQNGVKTSETDRILGRLNQRIGLAANGSDKYSNALNALGISNEEISSGTLKTEDAFRRIIGALNGIEDPAMKSAMASEIFGTVMARKLMPAINAGSDSLRELEAEKIKHGVIDREQAAAAEAFGDKMNKMGHIIKHLAHTVGIELIPVFMSLLQVFQNNIVPVLQAGSTVLAGIVTAFNALPGPMQMMIVSAIAIVAAVGPLLIIFGKIITTIGSLITAFSGFGVVIAAIASPIGLAIVAVGLLAAAGYMLWKEWDKVVAWFETLPGKFSAVWDGIKNGADTLIDIFSDVGAKITDFFSSMLDDVIASVSAFAGNLAGAFVQTYNDIKQATSDLASYVLNIFSSIAQGVVSRISSMVSSVLGLFAQMRDSAIQAAADLWNALVGNSIIIDIADDTEKTFARMKDRSVNEFEDMKDKSIKIAEKIQTSSPDDAENMAKNGRNGRMGSQGSSSAESQNISIDLRNSIFKDDSDMINRLRRAGSNLTGAFA